MATVVVNGRRVPAQAGGTLFQHAGQAGVRVPTSCHEQGKCRECLVEVERGADGLDARSPEEQHLTAGFRLSCRARVTGDADEVRCHTLRRDQIRIETEARGLLDVDVLDPPVRRQDGDLVRRGEKLGPAPAALRGLAVDLGTTTVALRLFDLEDGRPLATHAFENPQRFGGSEVMARIRYDGEHGGRLLQRTLCAYLNHAIDELPGPREQIVDLVVAGNPTMRDLFFGLDVQGIGEMPYRSITEVEWRAGQRDTTGLVRPARRLGLDVHPAAEVYGLPLVGSHVGADTSAGLLATGMGQDDRLCVLMDIGTNTEVVLGNRERLIAASCPAGPAFEGGEVRHGVPALRGAIERVRIDAGGAVDTSTVGDAPAVGICGSGLVDVLGELCRTGLMNAQGRLQEDGPGVSVETSSAGIGTTSFVVDAGAGIRVSEADVNVLAQAKGANVAGLRVLLRRFGIHASDIDRFYLAGGFADRLDLDAARRIGLIPDLEGPLFRKVGNACLQGASLALLSARRRQQLETLVPRIEHVSLETDAGFFDLFVDGCQFRPFGGVGRMKP